MFTRRISCGLLVWSWTALAGSSSAGAAVPAEVGRSIKAITAIGPEGRGNSEATAAFKKLSASDVSALPSILTALNGTNDLAATWLRSAVESIASRELAAGHALPVAELEKFLARTSNSARARRLAFELIDQVDHAKAEKLIAGMVNDPGSELRRDAVGRVMARAAKLLAEGKKPEAKATYQELLTSARDVDQVDDIAKNLRTLGENVDLAKTFGFVTQWKVVGPFDSVGGKGFAAVYPPEEKIDPAAEYMGKTSKVRWQDFTSKDEYGNVSMNLPYTQLKGVAAYAYSDFVSEKRQSAEIRIGSQNAFKVWLNGKFLFGQEEYHRNKAVDQYRINASFQPGLNVILVKVCQNEQTEDWASDWDFQLRVCDPAGAPLRSAAAVGSTGGKL